VKAQVVTPYRVSHLKRYEVTVRGNVTSVDPPLDYAATGVSSLYYTLNKLFTCLLATGGSGSFSLADVEGTLILRLFCYVFYPVPPLKRIHFELQNYLRCDVTASRSNEVRFYTRLHYNIGLCNVIPAPLASVLEVLQIPGKPCFWCVLCTQRWKRDLKYVEEK
jgi:hypothetical protein